MRNPWAWTKQANLLALESPAGVGYSYCEASLGGGSCANTDNSTASTSLASVVDFFQNKFPTLARNPFYITGESYAGVYVPTLARWIVDHNDQDGSFKIHLTGRAAGDPCTDNKFQADSVSCFGLYNCVSFYAEPTTPYTPTFRCCRSFWYGKRGNLCT